MNAYGAWQLTAVLVATLTTIAVLAGSRMLNKRTALTVVLATFGGFIGARLLKVAFRSEEARESPALIWTFDFRGLDMAGVILGMVLIGGLTASLFNLSKSDLANAAVPGLAIGMSLSKVGCLVAGCCFGKVYGGIGSVPVPRFSDAHFAQIRADLVSPFGDPLPLFPVQILEIIIPLVALVTRFALVKGQEKGMLVFLAAYGVLKAAVTFLRFPDGAGNPPLVHITLYLLPLGILLWNSAFLRQQVPTRPISP